ncbi:MAG TPA: NADH-quinone oxidoreductase subunit L [Anaerolineae bacterium]|nr:NADH-quinone oxidoreductase subunit L [Anaerolineae bacterium]
MSPILSAEEGGELFIPPQVAGELESLLVLLVLGLPLAGFLLTGLVGRRLSRPWIISVAAIVAATLIATYLAFQALGGTYGEHGIKHIYYTWIAVGDLRVEFGYVLDNLSALMLIVVTWIGALVHVYSIGYMAHDPGKWRFFAYLNLFMFSMLLLVLASSYLVVFAAWELVGLSSYLLIGFWYTKRAPALASKKAFLVNRVADHSFLVGIMAIFLLTGTMDFFESFIEWNVAEVDPLIRNAVAVLLFAGAAGKSAQFPFHVWLPDAMEGPTPVSALIHAATMVNAGVYFIARTTPIFASAPEALLAVAVMGTFTAVLAATIALTQKDIKRVLAYSTLSQLGYMFVALGVGAWLAAIFHLMAHGFTKGLLFLGSGSVIHAVHEEQDMTRMGALWRKIPWTHATFLIGALSLAGIPLFAGFFSKDTILDEAFVLGWWPVYLIGVLVAGLTGFYMFRLMGLTFYGKSRVDPAVEPKIHESPATMVGPLVALAIPTIFLGLVIGLPLGDSTIKHWLEPVFHPGEVILGITFPEYEFIGLNGGLIVISVALAALGIGVAIWLFGVFNTRARLETVDSLARRDRVTRALYTASLNKWYFDDLYHVLFFRLGGLVASGVMWFDVHVIDGVVNGVGTLTQRAGVEVRHIQTGRVQNYALDIAVGLVVVAAVFILLAR